MIDKITEGFNLAFRWMGIWLACNLVTGVIIRVEIALEQRKARLARRRLAQYPSHLPVPQRRQKPDAEETETPEDEEAAPDNAEHDTDADDSETQ
ncbi:MAG: hypothetical protein IJT94_01010 [Oscillibacter sp.]|nr:hypothetical protein [Oscillibacter sp.]